MVFQHINAIPSHLKFSFKKNNNELREEISKRLEKLFITTIGFSLENCKNIRTLNRAEESDIDLEMNYSKYISELEAELPNMEFNKITKRK